MKPRKNTIRKLVTEEKNAAKMYRGYGLFGIAKQESSHAKKLKRMLK